MEDLSELEIDVAQLTAALVTKWRGHENEIAAALAQNLAGFVAIASKEPQQTYEAICVMLNTFNWREIRAAHFGAATLGVGAPTVVKPSAPLYMVGNPRERKPSD